MRPPRRAVNAWPTTLNLIVGDAALSEAEVLAALRSSERLNLQRTRTMELVDLAFEEDFGAAWNRLARGRDEGQAW